jgi:hypothetical protein
MGESATGTIRQPRDGYKEVATGAPALAPDARSRDLAGLGLRESGPANPDAPTDQHSLLTCPNRRRQVDQSGGQFRATTGHPIGVAAGHGVGQFRLWRGIIRKG